MKCSVPAIEGKEKMKETVGCWFSFHAFCGKVKLHIPLSFKCLFILFSFPEEAFQMLEKAKESRDTHLELFVILLLEATL